MGIVQCYLPSDSQRVVKIVVDLTGGRQGRSNGVVSMEVIDPHRLTAPAYPNCR